MGCPAECYLGDSLVFSITTHDPDTGILTDASSNLYRIYEDETAAPITTGTLAKLDDANTTGFYTESITVNTANGYEHGKTYTIYIEATVDSDKGGITFAFKATDKDYLLKRDMSDTETEGAAAAARSPLNALRWLRNHWAVSAGILSVKKEDDVTEAWNATLTGDANANPIVGSDPS